MAEAIERGGLTAKTDELVSAIGNFATTSARQSLAAPNVTGYAGLMGAAGSLHIPGLDVQGAANLFGRADQVTRHGGGMGEKSMMFQYQNLAPQFKDLNLYDLDTLNGKGLLGTAKQAFGRESVAYRFAEQQGDKKEMARLDRLAASPNANMTNFEQRMDGYKTRFGGQTNLMADVMRNDLLGPGATMDEARTLAMIGSDSKRFGQMKEYLTGKEGLGLKEEKINASALASMAQVWNGGQAVTREYSNKLMEEKEFGHLSVEEKKSLTSARANGDEKAERDAVLKALAGHDRMTNDGQRAADAQISLDNQFKTFAGQIVPLTTAMNEGMSALVRTLAPFSDYAKALKVDDKTLKHNIDIQKSEIAEAKKELASGPAANEKGPNGQRVWEERKKSLEKRITESEVQKEKLEKWQATRGQSAPEDSAGEGRKEQERIAKAAEQSAAEPNMLAADVIAQANAGAGKTPEVAATDSSPMKSEKKAEKDEKIAAIRRPNSLMTPAQAQAQDKAAAKEQARIRDEAALVAKPSKYDDTFREEAERAGIKDWRLLKERGVVESGLNPDATHKNRNGTVDTGIMQINSANAERLRAKGITDLSDPRQNIRAGAIIMRENLDASGGDVRESIRRYNGSGEQAEAYGDHGAALHRAVVANADAGKVPHPEQTKQSAALVAQNHNINIQIADKTGKPVASPVQYRVSSYGPPSPAGAV